MAWLTISGSQVPLRCWFERPPQPRSLVLVLPEVFGINSWLRDVASQLVEAGHGVLVMPLFARTAPALDVGYDAAGLAEGRQHRDAVTAAGFQSDVDAVLSWLAQQPELAHLPLAGLGFCFGGHLAWHLAARPELKATASFYGARVSTFSPGGGPPTLQLAAEIPGRLLVWLGADDPLMPADEQQAIGSALRAADPSAERLQCRIAPAAGHGFMCSQRSDFQPEAAEQGWQSLLELLDQVAEV
jgi:carboxymethylenebutenolidase